MASLIPILMSNGEAKTPCDGQFHDVGSLYLNCKTVVKSYLFCNLITPSSYGADIVIHSPAYWNLQPPQSNWGTLGDLHIFSQPNGHTGGRQGEAERDFQPDGIDITDWVTVKAIGWGGGTMEIYAQIWVREQT